MNGKEFIINQGILTIKSIDDPKFNYIYLIGGHDQNK
jgi:hypothetical protein